MTDLQIDPNMLHQNRTGFTLYPTYYNNTLPNGVCFDFMDNLQWMVDIFCSLSDNTLLNLVLNEYHNTTRHPATDRTLLGVL
jgi:hypothetical protein